MYYIESNYFETIKNIFKSYPDIQLLGFGYYSIVENNNFITVSSDKIISEKFYIKNRDQLKKKLVKLWDDKMLYNIWNKVYLKSIIDKNNIKFYDENWGEDMDFNRKYLSVISNFYLSDEAFYNYVRERIGASTNRYRENFYDIRRNEFIEFNNYFKKNGIEYSEYIEFSSRRFVECVLGVIENLFSSNLNFRSKYQKIKKILNDKLLQTALKNTNSKTLKTKIMLIPLKIKNVLLTMLMGKFVNVIKNKMPGLFNHLKNNR